MNIEALFRPINAKSGNLEEYSQGSIPFVSNSNLNNGVVGYVEPNTEKEVITEIPCIAVNGFGFATIQTEPFIGAGNGGIHVIALIPKKRMDVVELAYYASQLNHSSWRFSYGRRAILRRLQRLSLQPFSLSPKDAREMEVQFSSKTAAVVESLFT